MNFDQTLQEQCMSQYTEVEKPIKPHNDNRDSKQSENYRKPDDNHQAYLFDENENPNTQNQQINN